MSGDVAGGGGGTIIIGNSSASVPVGESENVAVEHSDMSEENSKKNIRAFTPSEGLQNAANNAGITSGNLVDIIQMANEELLRRAQSSLTPELEQASKEYAEKLKLLTETLDRVEQQS